MGANSFLYEMTPIYMGGNNEKTELHPLKVYTFTLRWMSIFPGEQTLPK